MHNYFKIDNNNISWIINNISFIFEKWGYEFKFITLCLNKWSLHQISINSQTILESTIQRDYHFVFNE